MVIGGIIMIVTAPFQNMWILIVLILVPCILPVNLFLSVLPQDNFIIMLFHFYIQSAGNMPADFFVIHPEKLPMAGGIYFIYAMYGLCVRNMVV